MSDTKPNPLAVVREAAIRIQWITDLCKDAVYVSAYRVQLLDSGQSPATVGEWPSG